MSCPRENCDQPSAGEETRRNLDTMGYKRVENELCEAHVDEALASFFRYDRDRKIQSAIEAAS